MTMCVNAGSMCSCSFGAAPSALAVTSPKVLAKTPLATISDCRPMVNIFPFGMCSSLANPTVASATAAALGVLTPMPCVPNIASPWTPGAVNVWIGGTPALLLTSKCFCAYGGVISITNSQAAVMAK